MATLSDLKTRVQTELNRDDLADDLADSLTLSIQQSIDYYAPQRFWFNEKRTTSTMTYRQGVSRRRQRALSHG